MKKMVVSGLDGNIYGIFEYDEAKTSSGKIRAAVRQVERLPEFNTEFAKELEPILLQYQKVYKDSMEKNAKPESLKEMFLVIESLKMAKEKWFCDGQGAHDADDIIGKLKDSYPEWNITELCQCEKIELDL